MRAVAARALRLYRGRPALPRSNDTCRYMLANTVSLHVKGRHYRSFRVRCCRAIGRRSRRAALQERHAQATLQWQGHCASIPSESSHATRQGDRPFACPTPCWQIGAATLWAVAKGWEAARGFLSLLLAADWETARYDWLRSPAVGSASGSEDADGDGEKNGETHAGAGAGGARALRGDGGGASEARDPG
jgi:hypothetical protein